MDLANNPAIQNIWAHLFGNAGQLLAHTPPLHIVVPPPALEVEIEGSSTEASTPSSSSSMQNLAPNKKSEKKEKKRRRPRTNEEEPTIEQIREENRYWGRMGEEARIRLGEARDRHKAMVKECEKAVQEEEKRNEETKKEIWELEEYILNLKSTNRSDTHDTVTTAPNVPEEDCLTVTEPPPSGESSSTRTNTSDSSVIDSWIQEELDEIGTPSVTASPMPTSSTSSPPETVQPRNLMRFEEVFWRDMEKYHLKKIEECPEIALFPKCFFNPYHPNKFERVQKVKEIPSASKLYTIFEEDTGLQPDEETMKKYDELYKRLLEKQKDQSGVIVVQKKKEKRTKRRQSSQAKRARLEESEESENDDSDWAPAYSRRIET